MAWLLIFDDDNDLRAAVGGLQLLRSVRGKRKTRQVPVIVLTGADPGERPDHDVHATVPKPFGIDALVAVIERARRPQPERRR
jgi:DNA-binding response OmpR family regulator